ncbi:GrpB family protein [Maricaulis sp.]|uniref:GrpB family protein n=1 Tax=Maricaulis sp. TaxID=1486257 RepID=UPI003A8D906C
MTVDVVDYDPGWPARFTDERKRLQRALGDAATRIEHVGSTSVPGLAAKPIIDILVGTHGLAKLDGRDAEMICAGFQIRGENGIAGRRYYRRHAPDGTRLVHVHAYLESSEDFRRHLAFRDYLRAHPVEALALGRHKLAVASSAASREAYQAGKSDQVADIERNALAWSPGKPDMTSS